MTVTFALPAHSGWGAGHVQRRDILDVALYESRRHELRPAMMLEKRRRQILVGDCLNFMFENPVTVQYQIQEVLRVEGRVDEGRIEEELRTYNQLLGGPGELGCTLLIELCAGASCARPLQRGTGLRQSIYLRLADGRRIHPVPLDRDSDASSLVQFLRFRVGGAVPVALGAEHPAWLTETLLKGSQREALAEDLRSHSWT